MQDNPPPAPSPPSAPSAFEATMMADARSGAGRRCAKCGGFFPSDYAVCPRDATPLGEGDDASGDPLVGAILGGSYRLLRVLGEGGMARLYEAEHLFLDRRYAIKVIHEYLARREELLARFEREARAASRIRSEHVVQVIDLQRTADGRPCIVAELLEGEDLQQHLKRVGVMTPTASIPIVRQICLALAEAHACGVVHRDLKPSNVFLARGEGGRVTVKILDFGVAKLIGDRELTSTGAVVGTPAYMAPEQAEQAADAGPLADVYAAGAVLYRMLTGQAPYAADSTSNPLVKLLHEEPARPRDLEPTIPAGVEAVIQRAMARDPRARPATALALEAQLAAFDMAAAQAAAASPDGTAALAPGSTMAAASSAIADEIVKWARTARPIAIALMGSATLAVGLFAAALLASIVAVARPAVALTGTEKWLVGAVAVAAAGGIGYALVRGFRRRWPSTPAVRQLDRLVGGALLAGVLALGGLELVLRGLSLFSPSLVWSPRLGAGVLAAAAVASGLELWRRWRT
jgi:serine/threonine-protein kinase